MCDLIAIDIPSVSGSMECAINAAVMQELGFWLGGLRQVFTNGGNTPPLWCAREAWFLVICFLCHSSLEYMFALTMHMLVVEKRLCSGGVFKDSPSNS